MTKNNIKNCTNNGTIIGNGTQVGGIVAMVNNSSSGEIIECNNYGNVTGSGQCIGGIIGDGAHIHKISKCTNKGIITGNNKWIGGIGGYLGSNVEECINYGKIIGDGEENEQIGGIAGAIACDMKKCCNNGEIIGFKYIGRNIRIF